MQNDCPAVLSLGASLCLALRAASTDATNNGTAPDDISRVSYVVSYMAKLAIAIKPLLAEVTDDLAAMDEEGDEETAED